MGANWCGCATFLGVPVCGETCLRGEIKERNRGGRKGGREGEGEKEGKAYQSGSWCECTLFIGCACVYIEIYHTD